MGRAIELRKAKGTMSNSSCIIWRHSTLMILHGFIMLFGSIARFTALIIFNSIGLANSSSNARRLYPYRVHLTICRLASKRTDKSRARLRAAARPRSRSRYMSSFRISAWTFPLAACAAQWIVTPYFVPMSASFLTTSEILAGGTNHVLGRKDRAARPVRLAEGLPRPPDFHRVDKEDFKCAVRGAEIADDNALVLQNRFIVPLDRDDLTA